MRILTLHLYSTFTYCTISSGEHSFSDIPHALGLISSARKETGEEQLPVSEIALFTHVSAAGKKFSAAGSEIGFSCAAGTLSIPEGNYLFCQFSDFSAAGIENAFEEFVRAKTLPAGAQVILRLVNEAGENFSENPGDYAFQLLSPLF